VKISERFDKTWVLVSVGGLFRTETGEHEYVPVPRDILLDLQEDGNERLLGFGAYYSFGEQLREDWVQVLDGADRNGTVLHIGAMFKWEDGKSVRYFIRRIEWAEERTAFWDWMFLNEEFGLRVQLKKTVISRDTSEQKIVRKVVPSAEVIRDKVKRVINEIDTRPQQEVRYVEYEEIPEQPRVSQRVVTEEYVPLRQSQQVIRSFPESRSSDKWVSVEQELPQSKQPTGGFIVKRSTATEVVRPIESRSSEKLVSVEQELPQIKQPTGGFVVKRSTETEVGRPIESRSSEKLVSVEQELPQSKQPTGGFVVKRSTATEVGRPIESRSSEKLVSVEQELPQIKQPSVGFIMKRLSATEVFRPTTTSYTNQVTDNIRTSPDRKTTTSTTTTTNNRRTTKTPKREQHAPKHSPVVEVEENESSFRHSPVQPSEQKAPTPVKTKIEYGYNGAPIRPTVNTTTTTTTTSKRRTKNLTTKPDELVPEPAQRPSDRVVSISETTEPTKGKTQRQATKWVPQEESSEEEKASERVVSMHSNTKDSQGKTRRQVTKWTKNQTTTEGWQQGDSSHEETERDPIEQSPPQVRRIPTHTSLKSERSQRSQPSRESLQNIRQTTTTEHQNRQTWESEDRDREHRRAQDEADRRRRQEESEERDRRRHQDDQDERDRRLQASEGRRKDNEAWKITLEQNIRAKIEAEEREKNLKNSRIMEEEYRLLRLEEEKRLKDQREQENELARLRGLEERRKRVEEEADAEKRRVARAEEERLWASELERRRVEEEEKLRLFG
jgi:hypothetical protein